MCHLHLIKYVAQNIQKFYFASSARKWFTFQNVTVYIKIKWCTHTHQLSLVMTRKLSMVNATQWTSLIDHQHLEFHPKPHAAWKQISEVLTLIQSPVCNVRSWNKFIDTFILHCDRSSLVETLQLANSADELLWNEQWKMFTILNGLDMDQALQAGRGWIYGHCLKNEG